MFDGFIFPTHQNIINEQMKNFVHSKKNFLIIVSLHLYDNPSCFAPPFPSCLIGCVNLYDCEMNFNDCCWSFMRAIYSNKRKNMNIFHPFQIKWSDASFLVLTFHLKCIYFRLNPIIKRWLQWKLLKWVYTYERIRQTHCTQTVNYR